MRYFQQRAARILRGVSVPTATPLVRKRVIQTPNGADRAQVVARAFRRRRAHIILRSNPTATVPAQPPKQPIVSRSRRAARVRATVRNRVHFIRSFVAPTRPTRVITGSAGARRAAAVRFTRRHRAHLIAPRVVATPVQRQQQPRIVHQRAAHRIRYTRARQPILLRGPLVVTGRRTVKTVTVVRNRRAANVRAYYQRHRLRYETSTLGTAASIVIFTAEFDHAAAAGGPDRATPSAGIDRNAAVGAIDRGRAGGGLDRGVPVAGLDRSEP